MNAVLRIALTTASLAAAPLALADVTFYENEGFGGRSFSTTAPVSNFERAGFNDRASSVIVIGERWEVCEDARFSGRCVVLRPGRYPSLAAMGLNDRASSVRVVARAARVEAGRYGPAAPMPVYDNRRRNNERLFEADVSSVRAVVGPSEQRCWVEREQAGQDSGPNVPGAVVGAILGGILGHQVGNGRGNDLATVGGAVAGGAIGANVGRDRQSGNSRDLQRCETVRGDAQPAYYDVTYSFRGREHRIQMSNQPGRTVSVNAQGEPRA
jgi:uncharacterized protein YcfJ